MNARKWNVLVWVVLLAAGATSACVKRTYVVVPRPSGGYRPSDTLRATQNGGDYRVTFRFDTVTRTRTQYVTDTLWREGTRIIRDTVRLVRRDTLRIVRRDTLRLVRVDTVRVGNGVVPVRVAGRDTVVVTRVRVDTVFRDRVAATRVDTVFVNRVFANRVDTVRLTRTDTVRLVRTDTIRVTRVDTVRVATGGNSGGGRRMLFVPPGQYPPEGQCRVWIHDRPPGQQAKAAPCDALGTVPAGAFILFGGDAWDFDYDWVANPAGAPAQIVALKRKRGS